LRSDRLYLQTLIYQESHLTFKAGGAEATESDSKAPKVDNTETAAQ
jgi:hypothetical protein